MVIPACTDCIAICICDLMCRNTPDCINFHKALKEKLYPCKEHSFCHECIIDTDFHCGKEACLNDYSNATTG